MKKNLIFSLLLFAGISVTTSCKGGGVPTHDHTYSTPTYVWKDDFSTCTAECHCTVEGCTESITQTGSSTYEVKTEPTCTIDGKGVYTVTFSNDKFSKQTKEITLSATGHDYSEVSYTWGSDYTSCTASRVCNSCGDVEEETVTGIKPYRIEPTCSKEGSVTYIAVFKNTALGQHTHKETLQPTGKHNFGAPVYTWSDDHTSCTGVVKCSNEDCKEEVTETVKSITVKVVKEPTCEADGETSYTATFTNTDYFAEQQVTVKVDRKGHEWSNPTYTWKKSSTQNDDEMYNCTAERHCTREDCTESETETLTNLTPVVVDPTCTEKGSKTYTATFENTNLGSDTNVIEITPTGHNYGQTTYTWSNDHTTCTARHECTNTGCDHFEESVCENIVPVETPATCTTAGSRVYTATFSEEWAKDGATYEETIQPTGEHHYEYVNFDNPTKTSYNAYDDFESVGFSVNLKCHDCADTKTVSSDQFTFSPTSLRTNDKKVTAHYTGSEYTINDIEIGVTVNKCTESIETPKSIEITCHTQPSITAPTGKVSGDTATVKYYSDNECTQEITNWNDVDAGSEVGKIHTVYTQFKLTSDTQQYEDVTKVITSDVEHNPISVQGTGEDVGKDIVKCSGCDLKLHEFTTQLPELVFDNDDESLEVDLSTLSSIDYSVYSDATCETVITDLENYSITKTEVSTGAGTFSDDTLVRQDGVVRVYAKETETGFVHTITIPCINATKKIENANDVKSLSITTATEADISGYFIVTNDIDFEGSASSYYNYNYNMWCGKKFNGIFDGNNHTISNVYVDGKGGLFGIMIGAKIKNVNFVNCGLGATDDSGNYYTPLISAYYSSCHMYDVNITIKDMIEPKDKTAPASYGLGNALLFSRWEGSTYSYMKNINVDASGDGCASNVVCVLSSSMTNLESDWPTSRVSDFNYKVRNYNFVAVKDGPSTETFSESDLPEGITITKTEQTLDVQNAFVDVEGTGTGVNEIMLTYVTGPDAYKLTPETEVKDYATGQNVDWTAFRNEGSGSEKQVYILSNDENNEEVKFVFNVTVVTKINSTADWSKTQATPNAAFKAHFILTDNILNVTSSSTGRSSEASATIDIIFDGLGHTIDGLNISSSGGIFGANQYGTSALTKIIIKNVTFNSVSTQSNAGFSGGCGINQKNSYFKFIDTNITYSSSATGTCLLQNNGYTQNFTFTNCNIDFGGNTNACYFLYDTGKSTATNMPKFVNSTIVITGGSESSQGITRDNASNEHATSYDEATQSYPVILSGLTGVTFVKHVA